MGEEANYNIELMQLRLARLLYDYSINRKTVDENYIYKVIDIVIAGRGLAQYVSKYEIIRESQTVFAGEEEGYQVAFYDPNKQSITLSLEGITKAIEESKDIFIHLFPSTLEKYLYINFIVTQTILHELEHANQSRLMNEFNGMEPRILRATVPLKMEKKAASKLVGSKEISFDEAKKYIEYLVLEAQKKYHALYTYAPEERLAEIRSNQQLIDALNILKGQANKIISFSYANIFENMLRGYDDYIISPTVHYLKEMGNEKDLKQFDWYDEDETRAILKSKQKYNPMDRMVYGLPATFDEREQVVYELQKTIKYS